MYYRLEYLPALTYIDLLDDLDVVVVLGESSLRNDRLHQEMLAQQLLGLYDPHNRVLDVARCGYRVVLLVIYWILGLAVAILFELAS
jgi:hypothetical protein